MPFAEALSLHPDPAEATGEVVGAVLDALAEPPDLAVLVVSPHHVDAMRAAQDTARARADERPRVEQGPDRRGDLVGRLDVGTGEEHDREVG